MKFKWRIELHWKNVTHGNKFIFKKGFLSLPNGKDIATTGAQAMYEHPFLADYIIDKFEMYEIK